MDCRVRVYTLTRNDGHFWEIHVKNQIDAIRKKAMQSEQGDIFTLIYQSLKEIGITSYSVNLETGKRVYTRKDEQFEDDMNECHYIFGSFDLAKVETVIKNKSQKNDSRFEEWLVDMTNVLSDLAKAGVHRYIVSMTNNIAIYFDKNNTQAYLEFIPSRAV